MPRPFAAVEISRPEAVASNFTAATLKTLSPKRSSLNPEP